MPSDDRVRDALASFRREREAFRAAVDNTVQQVRSYLAKHAVPNGGRSQLVGAELGTFAQGRIDFERFASLFADRQSVDPVTFETMEHALTTLTTLSSSGDDLFVLDVPSGQDLRQTVGSALEEIGRAYGAARVFELSRTGQYRYSTHARSLGSFPFAKWNRSERRLTPPLIVAVDGDDVRAGGLEEFLDGSQKIVLLVRGACPPAPLVRLITPGTFVMQCGAVTDLARIGAWDGPGIAAVVGEDAAIFVHDPEAGFHASDRLTVERLPQSPPRNARAGVSVAQQIQELEQLKALAAKPVAVATAAAPAGTPATESTAAASPSAPAPPADPVDKLASWLLSQADLSEVE